MLNEPRVRVVESERAVVPEDQRLVSSGQCVPGANRPEVRVVDEEAEHAQQERGGPSRQTDAERPPRRVRSGQGASRPIRLFTGTGYVHLSSTSATAFGRATMTDPPCLEGRGPREIV